MRRLAFGLYLLFIVSWFLHLPSRVPGLAALRVDLALVVLIVALGGIPAAQTTGPQGGQTRIRNLLLVLCAYALVTVPFVEWPGSVLKNGLPEFVKAVVFYMFTAALVDSESRLRWLLVAFVGCQVFRVLEPVYLHLTQGYWGSFASMANWEYLDRLAGAPNDVINPNGLAWVALTALCFCHYLCPLTVLGRLFYLGALPVMIYALILTGSRSGFVGLLWVLGVVWYKSRRRVLLGMLAAGGVVALAVFLPQWSPDLADRYLSILSSNTKNAATAGTRVQGVVDDFGVALRRPLFGHGLGTSLEANANFRGRALPSHNLYTEVAQELGFVGLGLFLAFLVSVGRNLTRTVAKLRRAPASSRLIVAVTDGVQVWFAMNLLFSFASYGLLSYEWYLLAGLAEVTGRLGLGGGERRTATAPGPASLPPT